jgi:hypothetical protein
VSEITDPKNIDARLIGTVSVSHIGITCLLATDTAHAREAVRNLFCTWPEPDRSDLLWLLKSEGLSVDEVVSNGESQAPGPKQMRV